MEVYPIVKTKLENDNSNLLSRIKTKENNDMITYTVMSSDIVDFKAYNRLTKKYNSAFCYTPKSYFIMLLSLYDSYLYSTIKGSLYCNPHIIVDREISIPVSYIYELNNIEDINSYVLDYFMNEKVERPLKERTFKQLENLNYDITENTKKQLKEIFARRNLFTVMVLSIAYI